MCLTTKVCLTRHGESFARFWQTDLRFLLVHANTGLQGVEQRELHNELIIKGLM